MLEGNLGMKGFSTQGSQLQTKEVNSGFLGLEETDCNDIQLFTDTLGRLEIQTLR